MSTRCQIGFYATPDKPIEKPDALLYKHSDGYPEGVLPLLTTTLEKFVSRRYGGLSDTEYASAWVLYAFMDEHVKSILAWREESPSMRDYYPEDGWDCIGFGICQDFHPDIEYYYAISPNTLKVYGVNWDQDPLKWQLVNTIQIG